MRSYLEKATVLEHLIAPGLYQTWGRHDVEGLGGYKFNQIPALGPRRLASSLLLLQAVLC